MQTLPTSKDAKGKLLTIADFYEAGKEELELTLLAGEKNLGKAIPDPTTNRPGLALTGYFQDFASERLQLMGNSEIGYLNSLSANKREVRLQELVAHGLYCSICTNGYCPNKEAIAAAQKHGIVLFTSKLKTSVFTHLAAFVLERLAAPKTTIYGTMIEVSGLGVLIEGDPGLGKSETALGLIKRGCALVADDLTCIRKEFGYDVLFGSAADSTAGFMEIRGIGIIQIPRVFGIDAVRGEKRLDLVITFKRLKEVAGEIDRVGQTRQYRNILGVNVPNVIIPVSEGRDLVNLVETAAQQQKLLLTGYDPVKELSDRLRNRAQTQKITVKGKGRKQWLTKSPKN